MEVLKYVVNDRAEYKVDLYISVDGVEVGRLYKWIYECSGGWRYSVGARGPEWCKGYNEAVADGMSGWDIVVTSDVYVTDGTLGWGRSKVEGMAVEPFKKMVAWLEDRIDQRIGWKGVAKNRGT